MNRKKQPRLSNALMAAIGAAMIVCVLFVSFLFSSGLLHDRGAGIRLPEDGGGQGGAQGADTSMTAQSVFDVEINVENAQQVIASLTRPQAYSCKIENKLYYAENAASLFCVRYVSADAVRTDTVSGSGTVQSTLLYTGGQVYAWDMGDNTYYKGEQGEFSDDAAAMLPSYEDVLAPEIKLTEAGKQDVEFEPCVQVSFERGGYRCTYYISAASGLLKSASFYQGDVLKRRVTVSELNLTEPEAALFTLPNGQTVLGE